MPQPQAFNQAVSVFHFTSKISNAKIRKYKAATERGMGPGVPSGQQDATPPSNPAMPSTSHMEPPAKKPRLKLNAPKDPPKPFEDDTITVTRPKRDSSLRILYSEDMTRPSEDLAKQLKPSPAASSDLSTLSSAQSVQEVKASPVKKDVTPNSARPGSARQDYGDFMSWYVQGGDDEELEPEPTPEPPKAPEPPRQQPPAHSQSRAQFQHHVPPPYPPARMVYQPLPLPPPPPPPPPPQAPVQPVRIVEELKRPIKPDSFLVMKQKVLALSNALTSFGGVPPAPQSPGTKSAKQGSGKQTEAKDSKEIPSQVDKFLAIFDEDDSDEANDDGNHEEGCGEDADEAPSQVGFVDTALTYGIEFIMNALKSWGQQKMQQDRMRQHQQHLQHLQAQKQNQHQPQKRGPGRPRKFPNEGAPPTALPPLGPVKLNIKDTLEGHAIDAFQAVLDSGVLQVNTIYPADLSRALRHLYMQIDHLINQGAKQLTRWTCMSYGAQMAANKTRVDQAKAEIAQFESEVARQKHSSHQQIMQQMGIRVPQPGENSQQAQRINEMELERRRSVAHAQQQPYISQQHLNPLLLGSQPPGTPQGFAPPPMSAHNVPPGPPPPGERRSASASGPPPAPQGGPSQPSTGQPDGLSHVNRSNSGSVPLEKIAMYMPPGVMPRSGQSMKFSFVPTGPHAELAMQAFGPQSFPASHGQALSPVPNRGPMTTPPGHHGSPTACPSAPSPVASSESKPVEVKTEHPGSRESSANRQTNGHAHPSPVAPKVPISVDDAITTDIAHKTNGFTPVNAPTSAQLPQEPIPRPSSAAAAAASAALSAQPLARKASGQSRSASASASPALGSSSTTVSKLNRGSNGPDLASRFPHPGAVIVDQ